MGKSGLSLARVITATAMVAGLIASISSQSAGAEDLDTVKARAQSVADEVTELERRAQGLEKQRAALDGRIVDLSAEIGALESKVGDIGRELADAQDIYIERAIEAYKSGAAGTELDALLAAETMSEFISIAEINSIATSVDLQRLQELERARVEIEEAQIELDGRKQEQIEARAALEVLGAELRTTLADRRSSLRRLAADVRELEQQVRRDAKITQPTGTQPTGTQPPPSSSGIATKDIPDGYVTTGVSFGGVASWYGPGFEGNLTANGEIYDPMGLTAASKELPFDTLLFVKYQGHGVVVRINDRGPYVGDRIIDLSQGAAETIGMSGIGWIDATIVVRR
jgi:peptidoglycan hydrolase CwlO-like protein